MMKIAEIISEMRELNLGQYNDSTLIRWINEVDKQIHSFLCGFNKDIDEYVPHTAETDDVLVDEMTMYIHYLCAMTDFTNGEYQRYNNEITLYNASFDDFKNRYIKTHKHIFTGVVRL